MVTQRGAVTCPGLQNVLRTKLGFELRLLLPNAEQEAVIGSTVPRAMGPKFCTQEESLE